jgi:hypothetical protein
MISYRKWQNSRVPIPSILLSGYKVLNMTLEIENQQYLHPLLVLHPEGHVPDLEVGLRIESISKRMINMAVP